MTSESSEVTAFLSPVPQRVSAHVGRRMYFRCSRGGLATSDAAMALETAFNGICVNSPEALVWTAGFVSADAFAPIEPMQPVRHPTCLDRRE